MHFARPQQLWSITNAMIVGVTISGRVEERMEVEALPPLAWQAETEPGRGWGT